MTQLTNIPFDQLQVGDKRQYTKTLSREDVILFAKTSGDVNPLHLDEDYAKTTEFGECIGHGMWSGALISAAIATTLPGPGSIYRSQSIKFLKPVKIGDTLTVVLEVQDKKDRIRMVTLDCQVINQSGIKVAAGTAEVIASEKLISVPVYPV
jgi:3-hydroxybutyryl-CoA dehydratase